MKTKLVLEINANEGYSIDQVRGRITVGDLKRYLEDVDDDVEIVTKDLNNSYGANWGVVREFYEDDCEEDEDYED